MEEHSLASNSNNPPRLRLGDYCLIVPQLDIYNTLFEHFR